MREYSLAGGISRLESISAEFDYDKAQKYVLLAKEYLRGVRKLARDTPMFDLSSELVINLPEEAEERLAAFLAAKTAYAPTTRKI